MAEYKPADRVKIVKPGSKTFGKVGIVKTAAAYQVLLDGEKTSREYAETSLAPAPVTPPPEPPTNSPEGATDAAGPVVVAGKTYSRKNGQVVRDDVVMPETHSANLLFVLEGKLVQHAASGYYRLDADWTFLGTADPRKPPVDPPPVDPPVPPASSGQDPWGSFAVGTVFNDNKNPGGPKLPPPFYPDDSYDRYGGDNGQVSIVKLPDGRKGIQCRIGAVPGSNDGNNRAETVLNMAGVIGKYHAVAFDLYSPAGEAISDSWGGIFQVKDRTNEAMPIFGLGYNNLNHPGLWLRGNTRLAPSIAIPGDLRGETTRVCVAWKLATKGGTVAVLYDGKVVVPETNWDNELGSTNYSGGSMGVKHGNYRDGRGKPASSPVFTNHKIASGENSLAEAMASVA